MPLELGKIFLGNTPSDQRRFITAAFFGFLAPSERYPNANRLLMFLITCSDMGRVLQATASRVDRVYTLRGLKTTCLSKYRDVKLNSGLLKRVKREKLPNGTYKIVYECEFRKQTFQEALVAYLDEFGRRKKKPVEVEARDDGAREPAEA